MSVGIIDGYVLFFEMNVLFEVYIEWSLLCVLVGMGFCVVL